MAGYGAQEMSDSYAVPSREKELAPWLQGRLFEDWHAQFNDQGYLIFPEVLSKTEISAIRSAVTPYLDEKWGRNNFEGFKTHRVYSLLNKAPELFSDLATHPLALTFAEAELGRSCLLSSLLAIDTHPGETVQNWHQDDAYIDIPPPRKACGVSAFWTIDKTTKTNGATEIIPGSHQWTKPIREANSLLGNLDGAKEKDVHFDPQPRADSLKAAMPAGSLMLLKGTLWHRGGANQSDHTRMIITPQYCPGWARQLENIFLTTPKEIVMRLPKRTRELIGYSIHGNFLGYADGIHPEKFLQRLF